MKYLKVYILFLVFIFEITKPSFANFALGPIHAKPSMKWQVQDGASTAGGTAIGSSIAKDSAGNLYVFGTTTTALDGQTKIGSTDYFLTKYNSSGTRLWTILGGAPEGNIAAVGVAVDLDDYIYIVGSTDVSLDGQPQIGLIDFFLTKFDTSGLRIWTIQNGAPGFSITVGGIGIDSSRKINISGGVNGAGLDGLSFGGGDYFITQYNNSGVRQWTIKNGPGSYAASTYTDSAGNIYVCGNTFSGVDGNTLTGFRDMWVSKYNPSGVRQWTVQKGATSNMLAAYAVTADSSGNIYVTGEVSGTTALDGKAVSAQDMFIIKFNSSGTRQWTAVSGPPAGFTYATGMAIAVDGSGNVFVGGQTLYGPMDGQTLIGNGDLFLTKYNSSGTRQWTVEKGGNSNLALSRISSLLLDSSSNIFFTGSTSTMPIDGQTMKGDTDFILSRYDTSGNWQWTVENGSSSAPGSIIVKTMTTDASGNVIVTGSTNVGFHGQTKTGSQNYFLTKYNSNGSRQWTILNGVVGGIATTTGITTDSSNNIYIVGTIQGKGIDSQTKIGMQDYFVSKFNSSGVRQWTFENGVANSLVYINGVAVDSIGNVYTVGSNWGAAIDGQTLKGTQDLILTKFNSSGTRIWTIEAGTTGFSFTPGTSIIIDSSDNIFVSGEANVGFDGQTLKGTKDYYISKYTTAGAKLWTIQNGSTGATVGKPQLGLDSSGNIYLSGYVTGSLNGQSQKGSYDYFIAKHNSSGTRLWTKQSGVVGGAVLASDVKVTSSGDIFISGRTDRGLDNQSQRGVLDLFVTNYNTSGTRKWSLQKKLSSSSGFYDDVRITLGTKDRFYISSGAQTTMDGSPMRGLKDFYLSKY